MAAKRPLFTRNFSANLDGIENFFGGEGSSRFAELMARIVDDIVPQVCRFPLSGRSLLERSIHSTQAIQLAEKLRERLGEGDDVRELIFEEFLILYLVRGPRVIFLSIKHHRQLSYDLKGFWRDPGK